VLDGIGKQAAVVRELLADVAPDVPVYGCLCFVAPEGFVADSGLRVMRTLDPGQLGAEQARRIHAELAERLRAA